MKSLGTLLPIIAGALLLASILGQMGLPTAPKIVAIGDSLTEGQRCYDKAYPIQLGEMLGVKVINQGVCGDTTANMRARFDSAESLHPDYVLIMGGHNDLKKFDVQTIIANLQEMYDRALENGSKVVALTIPPYKECPLDLLVVNSWIMGQGGPNLIPLDTFSPLSINGTGLLDPRYGDSDLVHLNEEGYGLIADLLYSAVFGGKAFATPNHHGDLDLHWTVGLAAASVALIMVMARRDQAW